MFTKINDRIQNTFGQILRLGLVGTASTDDDAVPYGQAKEMLQNITLQEGKTIESTIRIFNSEVDGLTVKHFGVGMIKTVITFTDVVLGAFDGTPGDLGFGFDLSSNSAPMLIHAVSPSLSIEIEGTAHDVECAIGTRDITGETDATIAAAPAQCSNISDGLAITCDGTDTAYTDYKKSGFISTSDVYLNICGAWVADNEGDIVANGTIVIVWNPMTAD
jgi:hypothetical protein